MIVLSKRLLLMSGVALGAAASFNPAFAQQASPTAGPAAQASAGGDLNNIVVTARRREETLQNVPLSVSAVSDTVLAEHNLSSLEDISAFVPGLYDQETGSGRTDRSFEMITIRGIIDPLNPTVSVFMDGTPVPSPLVQNAGSDIERVEVLRGPQSAAFGKQTFAGAINYVTRDPGNSFHAEADALYGNYNWEDFRVSLEGPLIQDKLSLRVSGRYYSQDGQYKNPGDPTNPDARLGDQSTKSISASLVAHPTDGLKVKGFIEVYQDDDGPSSNGIFSNYPTNLLNCNAGAGAATYVCGALPKFPAGQIGLNTAVEPQFYTQALNNSLGQLNPIFSGDYLTKGGLKRDALASSLAIDYDIGNFATVSLLTGYSSQKWEVIQDLDGRNTINIPNLIPSAIAQPSYLNWQDYVQQLEQDFSQEVRISSRADQRFRWMIGGSYWEDDARDYVGALIPFGLFAFTDGSLTKDAIWGVFGSVNFDVTSKLTLTGEGRYQWDTLQQYTRAPQNVLLGQTFGEFAPRASIQYKFDRDMTGYVTYSRGFGTANFNLSILPLPVAVQQQVLSQYSASPIIMPSTLDDYEIGLKGKTLNGTLQYSIDGFYANWSNQIVSQNPIVYVNGAPDQLAVNNNTGASTVKGGEVELAWRPVQPLNLRGQMGYSSATYSKNLPCPQCLLITGQSIVKSGSTIPGAANMNASLGAEYRDHLTPTYDWYVGGDFLYRGRVYVDYNNTAWTPDSHKINLRAGVASKNVEFQLFADNLLDEYDYTGVSSTTGVLNGGAAILVGLPVKRQFGAKVTIKY